MNIFILNKQYFPDKVVKCCWSYRIDNAIKVRAYLSRCVWTHIIARNGWKDDTTTVGTKHSTKESVTMRWAKNGFVDCRMRIRITTKNLIQLRGSNVVYSPYTVCGCKRTAYHINCCVCGIRLCFRFSPSEKKNNATVDDRAFC